MLCFNCDKKYTPGHKCKKLFFVEGIWGAKNECYEEKEDYMDVESDKEGQLEEEAPTISLNALTGAITTNTMRLLGKIAGQKVQVLIDTRSSHSFLSNGLKIPISDTADFQVGVANGEHMSSKGKCKSIKLDLSNCSIIADFYLLDLDELDVVLRIQWLRILGPILWDFKSLTMTFGEVDQVVKLQGQQVSKLQCCENMKIAQCFKKRRKGLLMSLSLV